MSISTAGHVGFGAGETAAGARRALLPSPHDQCTCGTLDMDISVVPVDARPVAGRALAYHRDLPDARTVTGPPGGNGAHLVTFPAVDAALRADSVACEWRTPAHTLRVDLRAVAEVAVRLRRDAGQMVWDGRVVRLDHDLEPAVLWTRPVGLRETLFVAGLATNELFGADVTRVRSGDVLLRGCDLSVGPDGRLLPLTGSAQANIIGISTIGILAGEHPQVILVGQGARNAASGGLIAPSGSGSLEPDDVSRGGSLQEVLAGAMERELREESHVPANVGIRTFITGYGRWVQRGAKPEFFGVSVIDADADIIRAVEAAPAERGFVSTIATAPLDLRLLRDEPETFGGLSMQITERASLPLIGALRALSEALTDPACAGRMRAAGLAA